MNHDRYITIDLAAKALTVTVAHAYVLAARHHWRRTATKPRGYRLTDIRTTARARKQAAR